MKRNRQSTSTCIRNSPSVDSPNGKGTGICFDNRMGLHLNEFYPLEQESPARIRRPLQLIQKLGLLERCIQIPAEHIREGDLLKVHSPEYISTVKNSANLSKEGLLNLSRKYDAVYFNSYTWEASSLAAGTVLQITNQVAKGKLENALALVRPPGHHAMYNDACGYCFFGNVAIAAASLLDSPPLSVFNPPGTITQPPDQKSQVPHFKRVLILDWDVHHGQGTQYTFYNDNRVLFISIHRYEHQRFWPNLREGDFDFIGDGLGQGFNINVPLNKTEMTDSDYLAIFHTLIMPIAYEFNPEIILVSSGFDAALGDAEGKMWLSPACYGHMTHHLRTLAGGKLVLILEGGYFIDSLEVGCVHVLKALLGDVVPPLQAHVPPSKSVRRTLSSSIIALRQHWKCLNLIGLGPTVPRPDISRYPPNSWPLLNYGNWLGSKQTYSKSDILIFQKVLRMFPALSEEPPQVDVGLLVLTDKHESNHISTRWTDNLKSLGIYSYQVIPNLGTTTRTLPKSAKEILTPRKNARLSFCQDGLLKGAASLPKALGDMLIGLFKNKFKVAQIITNEISIGLLISVFSQVPPNLLQELRQPKGELSRRLFDQVDLQPSSSTASSLLHISESSSLKCGNRLLYVDLSDGEQLNEQSLECVKQELGKEDPSKKASVLAFSFRCSDFDLTLKEVNSYANWVSVPLHCCKSSTAGAACTHSVANMLAVLDAVILPMSYDFQPNLLIINAGGFTDKNKLAVSRVHVMFRLKNIASRLAVLVTPATDFGFLPYLLHDAPPTPFEQKQSTCAGPKIQEKIRKFICEQKRRYSCFAITADLPRWLSQSNPNTRRRRTK